MRTALGVLVLLSFCFAALASAAPDPAAPDPAALASAAPDPDDRGPAWQTRMTGGAGLVGAAAAGTGGAGLGGELGLLVWRQGQAWAHPQLLARASYEGLLLPGAAVGEEARGGLRLGPHGRSLGLDLGAELAWSRLDLPGMSLDPSLGLAVPIGVSARAGAIELALEVERLWLAAPERRGPVGWKGDEQALSVSLGHRPRATSVALRYRLHQSAEGQVHGLAMRLGA